MRSRLFIAAVLLASCGSDTDDQGDAVNDTPTESTSDEALEPPEAGTESTGPVTSDDPSTTLPGSTAPTTESSSVPESTPADPTGESTPERLARLAVGDLAERLDTDPAGIEVVSVEEVTWRDASLGCPQKDFAYAQVLTPGVRIVLESDGTTYPYHAGDGRDPFFCVDPQEPV